MNTEVRISLTQLLDPEFRRSLDSATRYQAYSRQGQLKICPNGCGALVASGKRSERWIFTTDALFQTCGACDRRKQMNRHSDDEHGVRADLLASLAGLKIAEELAGGYIGSSTRREAEDIYFGR